MLIGHNPGMEELAANLSAPGRSAAAKARKAVMSEKYPTAALAVLSFDMTAWKQVAPGAGSLIDFVRPKDLDGVEGD
jgi:phosphohistidine phosphatase